MQQEQIQNLHQLHPALTGIGFIDLSNRKNYKIGDFEINPEIPLPVQFDETQEKQELDNITPENIVLAMLRILAYHPDHRNADYYRQMITGMFRDISAEVLNMARERIQAQDYEEAEELYLSHCGIFPENALSFFYLALFYDHCFDHYQKIGELAKAGDYYALASQNYDRIFTFDNYPDKTYFYAGMHLLRTGLYSEGLDKLEIFIQKGSDQKLKIEAEKQITEIKSTGIDQKEYQEALQAVKAENYAKVIKILKNLLKSYPDSYKILHLLGATYRKIFDYSNAIDCLNDAFTHKKDNLEIINELGLCFLEVEDFKQAEKTFHKGLKINTEDPILLGNMCLLYFKAQLYDRVESFLRVLLELYPRDKFGLQMQKDLLELRSDHAFNKDST